MPWYTIFFAGSCYGNPGRGASAACIRGPNGDVRWHYKQRWSWVSIHEADYQALVSGLQEARGRGIKRIMLRGTSHLVINHLTGSNQVNSPSLRPLYNRVQQYLQGFDQVKYSWADRDENHYAIGLTRDALEEWEQDEDTRCYVHFGGATVRNPGWGGAGWVLRDAVVQGQELWSSTAELGWDVSCHEAAYHAFILGAQEAIRRGCKSLTFCGDSDVVINQVNQVWQVKSSRLQDLHDEAQRLLSQLNSWDAYYICRCCNTRADDLAQHAAEACKKRLTAQEEGDCDDGSMDGSHGGYGGSWTGGASMRMELC